MLNIGEQIVRLRKTKGWSQDDLAKQIGASRIMIGKYERGDNAPSIEVMLKLARAFEVSIDYLIGEGQLASFDNEVLRRMEDIENLDDDTKNKLFFLIDNVLQNVKAKKAFAS